MSDPRVRDALAASIDGHTSTEIPGLPSGCSNSQMTHFVSLALAPMLLAAGYSDLRTLGQGVCASSDSTSRQLWWLGSMLRATSAGTAMSTVPMPAPRCSGGMAKGILMVHGSNARVQASTF